MEKENDMNISFDQAEEVTEEVTQYHISYWYLSDDWETMKDLILCKWQNFISKVCSSTKFKKESKE